jgi:hypothetical protein
MKQRASSTPDYTIKQVGNDCFKVFDRNQHFRRSFGTRQGAQDWITEQRTGKAPQRAPEAAQMATQAS